MTQSTTFARALGSALVRAASPHDSHVAFWVEALGVPHANIAGFRKASHFFRARNGELSMRISMEAMSEFVPEMPPVGSTRPAYVGHILDRVSRFLGPVRNPTSRSGWWSIPGRGFAVFELIAFDDVLFSCVSDKSQ